MKTFAERRAHLATLRASTIQDEYVEDQIEALLPTVYGLLTMEIMGLELELAVLKSHAGYYIGTFDYEEGPMSRESQYFATRDEAQAALDAASWMQRYNP